MSMYQQPGMMGQQYGAYYQNPYGAMMGTQYVQIPKAKNTQPLPADVIAKLRQHSEDFNWQVNQEDIWKAQCTHKDKNGMSTLSTNPDGSMHCNICGADFNFFDGSAQEVEAAVKKVYDTLQTIKTIYLDIPENFAAAYFQFLPLMGKIPQLWERAIKNFSRYGDQQMVTPTNGYTTNNWGLLGQMTGNPMYAGYGAPMYAQQPMMQPMYGVPQQAPQGYMNMTPGVVDPNQQQAAVANPFVAQAPMPAQNPMMAPAIPSIPAPQQGMMYPQQQMMQPVPQTSVAPQAPVQQPAQQAAPAQVQTAEAPASNGEVVQQQTFKV